MQRFSLPPYINNTIRNDWSPVSAATIRASNPDPGRSISIGNFWRQAARGRSPERGPSDRRDVGLRGQRHARRWRDQGGDTPPRMTQLPVQPAWRLTKTHLPEVIPGLLLRRSRPRLLAAVAWSGLGPTPETPIPTAIRRLPIMFWWSR